MPRRHIPLAGVGGDAGGIRELIHAVARDVMQEVQAEAALQKANLAAESRMALLSALIDAIGVGVVLIDRDLLVAHWNREATRLTGIQADKVMGLPARVLGEAIAPRVEDFPSVRSHLQHAFSPVETSQFSMVILEPRRDVEVNVSPAVLAADGQQVGSVIVLHDIVNIGFNSHRLGKDCAGMSVQLPAMASVKY